MKKKQVIIVGIAVALVGLAAVYAVVNNKAEDAATSPTSETASSNEAGQSDTYRMYADMTGEEYDRNFIANMIAHHQGAVDMAKLALTNAKHQELKDMANDIVTAQEKEISDMKLWQQQWGYPSTSADNMQDHSAMGTMDEMGGMMADLEGKSGDAFDSAFITSMIAHHESAIDMARPGQTNAQHQEVKILAAAIVRDQTKEVTQLKQWQREWGYES